MLVPPQYSRIQKREVTTYLVTPRDRGTLHCSIQQAIDKADPYSRIVLACGQYFESVTLQQPLEIVGEEGSELPEITGRGVCLSVVGDVETYFENVKFTTKTSAFNKALNKVSQTAVRVSGGRSSFYKCEMTSLYVGGEANPSVSRCTIQGSTTGSGLVVAEGASGEYSDNTICNHLPYAVHVKSKGTPVFRENTIFQDPKFIIHALSGSYGEHFGGAVLVSQDKNEPDDVTRTIAPRFFKNKIGDEVSQNPSTTTAFDSQTTPEAALNGDFEQYVTERRAVVVEHRCTPHFEENTITGGNIAVHLATGSSGLFLNNNISHASLFGVMAGATSTATVRFNVISKCATGIFAFNTSVIITQNSVKENLGTGLLLLLGPDDKFKMEGNSFVGNDVGLSIRPALPPINNRSRVKYSANPGEGMIEKSYVCLNRTCGLLVIGEGFKLTLHDLEVGSNGRYGAFCAYGANPLLRKIKFERGPIGLLSEKCGWPTVEECSFTGHMEASMIFRDRGNGLAFKNSIVGFAQNGIVIDDAGNPTIRENTLASTSGSGITVTHGGIGTIVNNTIDMTIRGITIASYGDPVVHGNKISSCSEMGIYVFDEGCGTLFENDILSCGVGVGCSLGGECVLRNNTIKSCTRFGIVSSEGSRLIAEKNVLEGNVAGNILLDGVDSDSFVRANHVTKSSGFGIRSIREAKGLVIKNVLGGNRDGGLGTENGGNTTFIGNSCMRERGAGICVRKGGRGRFENNTIEHGDEVGVDLAPGAEATILKCFIRYNELCGVRLWNNSGGSLRHCTVEGNKGPGVFLHGVGCEAHTVLDGLTISANAEEGIRVLEQCVGKLIRSTISNHSIGARFVTSGAMHIDGCVFESNRIGLTFERKGCGTVTNCVFKKQDEADVEFSCDGSGTVQSSVMGEGSGVSVLGSFNGGGSVTNCKISGCSVAGGRFLKGCTTLVEKTTIANCTFGVYCEEFATPTVLGCTISHCTQGNVRLMFASSPLITKNVIELCSTSGIIVESLCGRIEGNIIRKNEGHGIEFFSASSSRPPESPQHESREASAQGSRRTKGSAARRGMKLAQSLEGGIAPPPTVSEIVCKGNKIESNEGCGVFFNDSTNATILDNAILLNSDGGVIVCAMACPEIGAGNKIHDNSIAGVVLRGQSNASMRRSHLYRNNPCNLLLEEKSAGYIEDCDIAEAVVDSIQTLNSLVTMKRCRITGCAQGSGMQLLGANRFLVVEDNEFASNSVGVSADRDRAYAKFTKNRFRHNILCGLRIEDGGCPDVIDNDFEAGTLGVLLKDGAGGTVISNRFRQNSEGLSITGVGVTTVCKENSFEDNDKGVVLRLTEGFCIENSVFGANDNAAISCEDGAKGTIQNNKFVKGMRGILSIGTACPVITLNHFMKTKCGVEVTGKSIPKIERNAFDDCDTGCRSSSLAPGIVIAANSFSASSTAGVWTEKQSNPLVNRNVFANCSQNSSSCAVMITENGAGSFTENDVHLCSIGVRSTTSGAGEFSRCMFHDCKLGASFDSAAGTSFERCTFFNNSGGDVVSKQGGIPLFKNCFFSKTSAAGSIQLTCGGSGTFNGNSFRDCQLSVLIEDAATPSLLNNSFSGGPLAILLRKGPARNPTIARNHFSGCELAIQCSASGFAMIRENFITGCEVGILIEKRSQVKVQNNTLHKMTKQGLVLRGNGVNVNISSNVFSDSPVGVQVQMPNEKATEETVPTVFSENLLIGNRINAQLGGGEVILRKNHFLRGDFGIVVQPDSRAVLDGNLSFDNMRSSLQLGSRNCMLSNNMLYSLNEGGAFEVTNDVPLILSKDNGVFNSCSCKQLPPPTSAPAKASDLDVFRAKDVLASLQTSLLPLHQVELPDFGACGCTAIPGSGDRKSTLQESPADRPKKMSIFRRASAVAGAMLQSMPSSSNLKKRKGSTTSDASDDNAPTSLAPNAPSSRRASAAPVSRRASTAR